MEYLRALKFALIFGLLAVVSACDDDEITNTVDAPATYTFERNGTTSVSFSGQTDRIAMAEELAASLLDFDNATEASLLEMFRNETAAGGDANPFTDADLNASTKSVRSKVAASNDFFSTNATESAEIKADFETWISGQATAGFSTSSPVATAGNAGQLADGTSARYVNAKGLEYNQAIIKSLIGALMADQMLNNYLGTAVLDEAENRTENDDDVLASGSNYTTMEHKWDEAYGYLYGASADQANPNATIGDDDNFLNKYVGRVIGDQDFETIGEDIYQAFKLGRAAIVAKNYTVRDAQAAIIRQKVSEVIAIRAVYYLQQAKSALDQTTPNYGGGFHDLSEGYGFIYSLRFTRNPNTGTSYFTKTEVDGFIADLMGGTNGFWDVSATTLDAVSTAIAAKFDFTVDQAGSTN